MNAGSMPVAFDAQLAHIDTHPRTKAVRRRAIGKCGCGSAPRSPAFAPGAPDISIPVPCVSVSSCVFWISCSHLLRLRRLICRRARRVGFRCLELLFLILQLGLQIGDLLHGQPKIILKKRDRLRLIPKIGKVRILKKYLNEGYVVVLVEAPA